MFNVIALVVLCLIGGIDAARGGGRSDADIVLKQVDELVVQGRSKYNEAISLLSDMLEKHSDNQKALYKRAEVRELVKEHTLALEDLKRLLELNPSSKMAYQLRSKILTRTGRFEEARNDWQKLTEIYAASSSKIEKTKKLNDAKERVETLNQLAHEQAWLEKILKEDPDNHGHLRACLLHMDKFLAEAKDAQSKYRLKKIDCAMDLKDLDTAKLELGRILVLQPQNLAALYLNAKVLKGLGATVPAITSLKRCLQLDPEHAECKSMHKMIRKYQKVATRLEEHVSRNAWSDVLLIIDESYALDSDPHNADKLRLYRCRGHKETGNAEEGKASCDTAIEGAGENNPSTWELHVLKAEIFMLSSEVDELTQAEQCLNKASELAQHERRIDELRQRLQTLLKRARQGCHYKTLGVEKSSTEKVIKKAYRVLAMKHHPDKLDGDLSEDDREKAGELYRKISLAYQILSDTEKRSRYDAGEDVDDQPQQHQNQHFHQGFRRGGGFGGGGGGGNFHFRWG